MIRRHGTRLLAAGLLLAALAACAQPGEPVTAAAPGVSATPSSTPVGSPIERRFTPDVPAELRVREPEDMRGIDPCELLTTEQLTALTLDPGSGQHNDVVAGPACAWFDRSGSYSAQMASQTNSANGKLPDLWKTRDRFYNVEILQIAGHPALRVDEEPTGLCALAVGVADDQMLTLETSYLDRREVPDPCATARRMAELVLSNLGAR